MRTISGFDGLAATEVTRETDREAAVAPTRAECGEHAANENPIARTGGLPQPSRLTSLRFDRPSPTAMPTPHSVDTPPGFASVVLDVDSTLCGIEGIDWLAARRGPEAGVLIAQLTDRAMNGDLALDSVYGERLCVVRPSSDDLAALAAEYERALAPGAREAVARIRSAGRRVVLVSGGIRNAILPVARTLGIDELDVHAVTVLVDDAGQYESYDAHSPMTTADGKRGVVASLGLPRRLVAVGDGATDLAIKPVADAFVAFTGFVRREPVVAGADAVVNSFDQLVELVLA
jgi:phosphoserine phosphatase